MSLTSLKIGRIVTEMRSNGRSLHAARLLLTRVGRTAALLLLGFHAWLLWQRLSGGSLLEPAIALRWAAALPMVAGLLLLRRYGASLFRGRRAAVLWLLVAVLHWSGAAPGTVDELSRAPHWLFVPAAAAPLALALGLLAAALGAARRRRAVDPLGPRPSPPSLTGFAAGFPLALHARPPPA